jgi:hypothetical protein
MNNHNYLVDVVITNYNHLVRQSIKTHSQIDKYATLIGRLIYQFIRCCKMYPMCNPL